MYVKPECGKSIYSLLTADLITRTKPMPDSVEVTRRLASRHTVVVVSAVGRGTFDAKRDWLRLHFPHIEHFIATHSKHLTAIDVLIDDGHHNLHEASLAGIRCVCFDQPYNQNWRGERVYNWQQVEGMF